MHQTPWAPQQAFTPPPAANGMVEGYPPLSPESSEEEIALPPPATTPSSIEPADNNNFSVLDIYFEPYDNCNLDCGTDDLPLPQQGCHRSG